VADAAWSDLERFCASIAGPAGDPRPIDELAAIARQVEADMRAASIEDLLAACYLWWRRLRWNAEGGDAGDALLIRCVLDELRRRGEGAATGCS
jgi:hypothetical protein